ncbi:hypothetical protein [Pendulispora albinea]|uniref:Uncharacterized protein n=1 Tax=Pendulispora albinea TaxID=2741071 RepID=A0ABZ2LL24_9BACT
MSTTSKRLRSIGASLAVTAAFAFVACDDDAPGAPRPTQDASTPDTSAPDAGPFDAGGNDTGVKFTEPALARIPMNTIVATKLLPQLEFLFEKLAAEKKDFTLDGQKAFNGGDEFLTGKIAIGFSYLLTQTPESDPKFAVYLARYREIADLTVEDVNKTWGIYYYMAALDKLRTAGLLDRAISAETLAKLKTKLDWRTFVNPADYTLIGLPTNYYGVAFSIAKLRAILGWEDQTASEKLLAKVIDHYQTYSGEYGFSDETDGQGRFDRYSVLLIGEICQRLIETNMVVSDQLKGWLRKSVDVLLLRLNPAGNGFDYGRSLGPYADTAFLEVLSAAAHLDVLTAEEKTVAYAFATRVVAKYVEFWQDDGMRSVNLWEKGRRTDGYRGKHRILGENLSLPHQILYTNKLWNRDGYENKVPMPTADFVAYLGKLPRAALTWFARGDYDRALVTYRDDLRIISLPLVNGGGKYHRKNAYFAVPHSYNLLSGAADSEYPQLQPKFTLGDGKSLIPASYIKNVKTRAEGDAYVVTYDQAELDDVGDDAPIKDARITATTEYRLEPGQITRTATYTPAASVAVDRIAMELGSFSRDAVANGNHVTFATGDVTDFEVRGLDACTVKSVETDSVYQTPTGASQTKVVCETGAKVLDRPLTITWVLTYRRRLAAGLGPR